MGNWGSISAESESKTELESEKASPTRCSSGQDKTATQWSAQSHAYKIVYGSRPLKSNGSLWQQAAGFVWQLMGGRSEHDFLVVFFRNLEDGHEFKLVIEWTSDGKKWTIEPADFEIPIVRMEEPFDKSYAEVRKIFDDYEPPTCSLLTFDGPHGLHR